MFVLHATFHLDPEHREEALDAVRELVEASNREDGVIDYRAGVDVHDENTLRFVERYEDAAAHAAHEETDHCERFTERLPDLLAADLEMVSFEVAEEAVDEFTVDVEDED
ncbi:antibiotic biosynthesis monooxygenase [Halarchaeum grantii]|uniref:Antibiotic biosynthesis monooxygenase n=1 Tax=Halarchaeum grantii TaxID=1193105 RepID=A0A830F894_9EURY|nr:putative quinol monooxygenase [Halarchaeum grantii]GGL21012.1 antibiotic biosynthesis monooxygenase [Halarchaeum grantii]